MHRSFPRLSRLALLTILGAHLCTAQAVEPTERDAWLWPFASTSAWNTPIGANAQYVNAALPAAGYIGVDAERHIKLSANDPVREIYPPSSWGTRWPGDMTFPYRSGDHWRMPVPDALIIADAAPPNTPNECTAWLMPNGREIRQLEPTCRLIAGSHIVGWPREAVDLYGDGHLGTHYGSGLSAIGGSLRAGEMISDEPLRHVLKLNLWGKYLYYNTTTNKGYRWPADRNDSYAATSYQGSVPALQMGSLVAIPPAVTPASIGITTEPGRKLFAVLQDYGAYISDDTGWNAHDLCADHQVEPEIQQKWGLSLTGSSGDLVADVNRLVQALHVVTNNSATNVGGGGTPRRPLAPPLADPALPVPTNVAASGPANAVHVTWNDVSAGESGYAVQRRATNGTWAIAATVAANVTTWTDSNASAGTRWEYRVRTIVAANVSAWSATVAVTPTAAPSGAWKINFQPAQAPLPSGYLKDSGNTYAARGNGQTYGWSTNLSAAKYLRDRNAAGVPSQQKDTHILIGDGGKAAAKWEMQVPNGAYQVRVVMGDPLDKYMPDTYRMRVEGLDAINDTATAATNWLDATVTVTVSDGRLTCDAVGGSTLTNKLCFIEITAAPSGNG